MAKVLSEAFLVACREAGIDTTNTRRIVIDIQSGEPPIVHIERYGDDRLINVVRALEGVQVERE